MIGKTLGHYRIIEKIGAGGMGEVYRAADTKLGRDVALKVLPAAFASDAGRMARFEREAHMLASLNHPNIASIHGLEESGGLRALVMELVEGSTLADRISAGRIPLEEVLGIAVQVAAALEAAHEKGIIHRDLKPANVKVTSDGSVKVLDFGLAKALAGDAVNTDASQSPTITIAATNAGVILGTAAYMSPEQAKGKPADKRADIWAFGVVLYEMLAGKQLYSGETPSEVLAAVIMREPNWEALPANTPLRIRHLLERCLWKDSKSRLRDIGDARIEIEEALAQPAVASATTAETQSTAWRRASFWILSALAALVVGAAVWNLKPTLPTQASPPMRFVVTLPISEPLALADRSALAISPNGSQLVYVARYGSTTQLYLRSLDRFETVPIAGTEGGDGPFFSPDGKSVGFFADGKLKTISLNGGLPIALCAASIFSRGASWGPDDNIIFTPDTASGFFKVPAAGGTPEAVTTPDREKGERGHRWPEILPGGKAVLLTTGPGGNWVDKGRIATLSLVTHKWKTLIEGGSSPHYSPTGHLLFVRSGVLFAVPFDPATLEVKGAPVPVLENLSVSYATGVADFSLSHNGTLVYAHGSGSAQRSLAWVDRKGVVRTLPAPLRAYRDPRISPDGRRVAVSISSGTEDIWVYDLIRDTLTRLTFEGNNSTPVWTPDGKRIAFNSNKRGRTYITITAADGGESEDIFTTDSYRLDTNSVSPDGSLLAYTDFPPITGGDVWLLPLKGDRKPRTFLNASYDERQASFSPDGRWMAYSSNESGNTQVYVQAFPGSAGKWQVSTDGGAEPAWSRDGRELFYRNGNKLLAVSILTTPAFTPARPRLLFEWGSPRNPSFTRSYDVAPDGQRFLMIKASEEESTLTQINIVLNWFEELRRRVPVGSK